MSPVDYIVSISGRKLLWFAGGIAVCSPLLGLVIGFGPFYLQMILSWIPLLLGCVAAFLSIVAFLKAKRRWLVAIYGIVLMPFAFGYPVWFAVLWLLYASGKYQGAMP
jgi:hypothetical protein